MFLYIYTHICDRFFQNFGLSRPSGRAEPVTLARVNLSRVKAKVCGCRHFHASVLMAIYFPVILYFIFCFTFSFKLVNLHLAHRQGELKFMTSQVVSAQIIRCKFDQLSIELNFTLLYTCLLTAPTRRFVAFSSFHGHCQLKWTDSRPLNSIICSQCTH